MNAGATVEKPAGSGSGKDNGNRIMRPFSRIRSVFGFSAPQTVPDDTEAAAKADSAGTVQQDFSGSRRDMMARVIAFDRKRVVDVMVPRADICAIDINTSFDGVLDAFVSAGHSRMPVYRGDLDNPVGIAHIKDMVTMIATDSRKRDSAGFLDAILRELLYVPPSMLITDLLLRMQVSRIHMALVIDEYGGTDGLVTIENLVEEIVGDINDEHDDETMPAVFPLPDGGWEADARVGLDDFAEQTGQRLETGEDEEIDTVGGYAASLAGRVPRRGEVLSTDYGYAIEIAEADARKLHKVRIRPEGSGQAGTPEK